MMTTEQLTQKKAELEVQLQQFVADANNRINFLRGKIEQLEELLKPEPEPPKTEP